ncbi:MAG: hypothetical protein OXE84_07430 [Rhodobacteraceae bacterium]|nr:hypothetical protein [Paracoccaceae bacterium]MCY4197336.1 hypothetical protein [Paracoccaceae bacterium]
MNLSVPQHIHCQRVSCYRTIGAGHYVRRALLPVVTSLFVAGCTIPPEIEDLMDSQPRVSDDASFSPTETLERIGAEAGTRVQPPPL